MRNLRCLSVFALLALRSTGAYATPFTLNAPTALDVYLPGPATGGLSGTLNIDTVTGLVGVSHFTFVHDGVVDVVNSAPYEQADETGSGYFSLGSAYYARFIDSAGYDIFLALPGTTLVGYAGGKLCSHSNYCFLTQDFYALSDVANDTVRPPVEWIVLSGTLSPQSVSATPEPGSWLLVATGLMAGATCCRGTRNRARRLGPAAS